MNRHLHLIAFVIGVVSWLPPALSTAQSPSGDTRPEVFPRPAAKILVLGTFHFKDAGLDAYKPLFDIDILSPERQKELETVIEALAAFRPTRIAVEADTGRQGVLDERFRAFVRGELELPSNEIYQLGFRLAKRMGHARVWAVDADARYYEPWISPDEWAQKNGQADRLDPVLELRYRALYRAGDERKTKQSLSETFLQMNEEERLLLGHGHYLVGSFEVGSPDGEEGELYPGADSTTAWYNRNLRIFANLQRITEKRDERILLIIGAGHVPILRHAIQASPQYELVEVADVLSPR